MDQKKLLTALILVLIFGFTLRSWIGLAALLSGQLLAVVPADGDRHLAPLGQFFLNTIFKPTVVWDLFQTGMVAAIAGLAAFMLGDRLSVNATVVAGALIVCYLPLFAVAIYLIAVDASPLWENSVFRTDISEVEFWRGWNAYVSNQAQVLAAQIALFLGLSQQKSSR